MSLEDKMLARFAKEQRKKHSRSALYNLDDDDDEAEEVLLTHNDKVGGIACLPVGVIGGIHTPLPRGYTHWHFALSPAPE